MDNLSRLGLTKNESKIYSALLKLGPSLAGALSRKTGIHRRTVYDVTERLIEKGLAGYISENNRRYFQASSPERFYELIHEQESAAQQIVPDLMKEFQVKREKRETLFYKGKNGLKTVFEDQLGQGKEILIIGGSKQSFDILKYYFPHYDRERQRKKIPVKIIFNHDARGQKRPPLATMKFLPKELSVPVATNIYGDTVSIILWSQDPFAIVIHDKAVADSYRNYFTLLWKTAKD